MLALLNLLDNQRQDIPMAAVLRSPLGDAPGAGRRPGPHSPGLSRRRPAPLPFHEAVVRYAAEQDDELAARLRDFLARACRLARVGSAAAAGRVALGDLPADRLPRLLRRPAATATSASPTCCTSTSEPASSALPAPGALALHAVPSGPSGRVGPGPARRSPRRPTMSCAIMSIHRSKGLEFPVVVLPDLGKAINLQDCQGSILVDRVAGLGMAVVDEPRLVRYPSLASTLVKERLQQQAMAEELRVLYVAMTRAREHLILVGIAADSACETLGGRWSNHAGAFPAEAILGCTHDARLDRPRCRRHRQCGRAGL